MNKGRWSGAGILIVGLTMSACAGRGESDNAKPADSSVAQAASLKTNACPGDNAGITLPDGFCATVFADSIVHARHIVVASNGDVYVTLEGAASPRMAAHSQGASFVALRDTTSDGRADIVKRIGTIGNTGIGIRDGYLYVDEGRQIVRYARADSQLVPVKRTVVLGGLPLLPQHLARNFTFGQNGALYVNVGSGSNSCQKEDRHVESPGLDPCPELSHRAGIWAYAADKTNQKFSSAERFATGLRNGMGLAVAADGKLFATQHGRDQLGEHWPKLFPSADYQAENPGEELVQVNRGDDFGWPYCYYAMDQKKLVDAPEYGGDGANDSRCTTKKAPIAAFPGHWAPMSLMFYTGTAFPERYRNGAFIAFHGSWNRAPRPQAGYRVVFQPLVNGAESGPYETFADGFAGSHKENSQPDTAIHRPVGLATAPDGSIFVTDDARGRIYRITYRVSH
ncbi:MAG: PQQ-dependent sugar dehydrogenase [Gemmatimonadaceae bacterium]